MDDNTVTASSRTLWLYLRFPRLRLEALLADPGLAQGEPDRLQNPPVAVVSERSNSHVILCCNDKALAQGVESGLTLSTALALCPELKTLQRQPPQEKSALQRLALLAYRFSPTVMLDDSGGLWLDLSGCEQLFRGYAPLLNNLHSVIHDRGFSVDNGIAHSPLAARLLCRDGYRSIVPSPEQIQSALQQNPVDQLVLNDQQQRNLQQLGLRCIGDLLNLPRAALGRRFGKELLEQIEYLLGERPCKLPRFSPPPVFIDVLQNPDGIFSKEGLLFPMKTLLQRLGHYLIARQRHCRAIQWQFEPLLGESVHMAVQLSASQNNWSSLLALSRLQLERLELPGSIEKIVLGSDRFVNAPQGSLDFFGDQRRNQDYELIDKLNARLGAQALWQPATHAQYLPEQASSLQPAGLRGESGIPSASPRPLWLLQNPQPVRQQDRQLIWREPLELLRGPERLNGNWWQGRQQRDYYLACDSKGARYWLFQDCHSKRWFVHGVFG